MILLALASLLSYSQGLRPDKVFVQGKDTLLCFGPTKSRSIAKLIIQGQYCDSISVLQVEKITAQDTAISIQAQSIDLLWQQKKNLDYALAVKAKEIANLNLVIAGMDKEILVRDKEIKRQKVLKWVGFVGAGIIGGIAIVK